MTSFIQQYVVPALILVVFLFTLVVVSARSFIPGDMAQPAPVDPVEMESPAVGILMPTLPTMALM